MLTYHTSYYASGVTGWTLEFSTNVNPTNKYNSSDYTSTIPDNKTKIKWIKWKKNITTADESGIIYCEVFIK